MKQLKKAIALILILTLLASLYACGSDTAKRKETEPTTENSTTEEPTTEEPTTEEPTTEEPTTEAFSEESGNSQLGITEGNTYTNEILGITCTLDSEWEVYDEAMLAQLVGLTASIIEDSAAKEIITNGGTVYDFYAAKDGGLSTLNINVGQNTSSILEYVDEETLLDLAMEQTEPVLTASGFENLEMTKESIVFAGEDHLCISLKANFSGMLIYERMVMLVTDDYIFTITACSFLEDNTADYLAPFTAIAE